ncbi:MAG: S-methyl-5-thioribose kinase [Caldilineaceae bacterium]|nr:S-methyl-5-thioribose kinase [Caldilineaceae bacterium]
MAYQELNEQTILDYIKTRPSLSDQLANLGELTAKEVGDGNLNTVYILESKAQPGQGIVIKQALPYLRVLGEDWKLTRERIRYETESLRLYNQYAPGLAPAIYDYDDEMSLVAMEYLSQHLIMRKALVARQQLPHFADHISTFMANTLFFTSDFYLTGLEKKELQARFINPHLCKIQEDFVFTNPLMESPENQWNPLVDDEVRRVRANGALKVAAAQMKARYMTHAQALIHSDLHTGSIMLNATDTRVIDSEFAFCGPMGFDVGALLENLILACLSHYGHTDDADVRAAYQEYLLQMVLDVWTQFAAKFDALWQDNNRGELVPNAYWDWPGGQDAFADFRRQYILEILRDTAGFGGCKFLRRMIGVVSVWDISSIENTAKRAIAERKAIRIGARWLLERHKINTIDDLIAIVRTEMART